MAEPDDEEDTRRPIGDGVEVDLSGPNVILPDGSWCGIDSDLDRGVLPEAAVRHLPLGVIDEALGVIAEAQAEDNWMTERWEVDTDPPHRIYDVEPIEGVSLHSAGTGGLGALIDLDLPIHADEEFEARVEGLLGPMVERLAARVRAPFSTFAEDDNGRYQLKVELPTQGNTVGGLLDLAIDARAFLLAARRGEINRHTAQDLLLAGHTVSLVGQPESDWLEAKGEPWRLSDPRGKAEAAKDLTALANAGGGLLVVPARTEMVSGREVINRVGEIPLSLFTESQLRDVLAEWTFPPLRDLTIDVVRSDPEQDRGTVIIKVAPCPEGSWPHLVLGDPDAPFPSKAVAAYVRDGDQNRAITASEMHGWIVAGRTGAEAPGIPPVEQAAMNRTLAALPRDTIRDLDQTEMLGGWREDHSSTVGRYAALNNEAEDRLTDVDLEAARERLHAAAVSFASADAVDGFGHNYVEGRRNVGRTGGELEGDPPETQRRYIEHARRVSAARDQLVASHEAFVELARSKSYDLSRLQGNDS